MRKKVLRIVLAICFTVIAIFSYVKLTSPNLEAGQITVYGTWNKTTLECTGDARDCCDVWYVEDEGGW